MNTKAEPRRLRAWRLRVWRWAGPVRVRSALVSLLVVGVVFVPGALGVASVLRSSLYTSATSTAESDAYDITSVIATRGHVPARLPISAEDMAAQVVGPSGKVLASSRNVTGQPAMAALRPGPGNAATSTGVVLHVKRFTDVDLDLDSRFVVAAVGYQGRSFSGTVLVADSLGAADHAVFLLKLVLGIALPLVALLVGFLVWVVTGWSLRPVEQIRSQVAGLSALDLHRRVPEPAVQDEIGRLAQTMNAMLARLEVSSDRQRQLVADVSHELRNPLASLQAQLEVAAAHPGRNTTALLQGSIAEVNRLSQLVDDPLTLARLDEDPLSLRVGPLDLDDLALAHADRLRARGKVEVSVAGVGAARVVGDEARLTRVVANLADNAERHASGRVEFAVARHQDGVLLSITDDGPGVPVAEREHIFERFVRLDSARAHQEAGAGLGLSIVAEIVRAHGGKVWVEDAGPGARFVLQLPLVDSAEPAPSTAGPDRRWAASAPARTR
jgi:signal transduction histidine kinase